jgi:guanylate kinase
MPKVDEHSLGPTNPPIVVVLSGPSGVGKDAVLKGLREHGYPVAVPATMTTRAPRPGEVDGVHHVFVTHEQFQTHLAEGELLEHAEVYSGHYYGVPRSQVRKALASGNHVLIRVDVQGAKSLRNTLPGALFVILIPNARANLEAHLRSRGSDDEAAIRDRLAAVEREYDEIDNFQHVIENIEGHLDATVDALATLIRTRAETAGREPIEV